MAAVTCCLSQSSQHSCRRPTALTEIQDQDEALRLVIRATTEHQHCAYKISCQVWYSQAARYKLITNESRVNNVFVSVQ
jgi:hypothetical protein